MNFHSDVRVIGDLKVISLSATEWRISDVTRDEHDGLALLGFVEQVGDFFEVTRLGRPRERVRFASMAEAMDALAPATTLAL